MSKKNCIICALIVADDEIGEPQSLEIIVTELKEAEDKRSGRED